MRVLMPESRIVRYAKSGSHALFANLFRYQLLRAGLGLYVDCDMYCVRPIEDADYIFGWQGERSIGNAILKLPPDSPILADLCDIQDGFIPPWIGRREQLKLRTRQILGRAASLGQMRWGTSGPKAVTWYAKQSRLASHVAPTDVFYPVAKSHIHLLLDPDLALGDFITPRTRAVHLWHQLFVKRAERLKADPSLVAYRRATDIPPGTHHRQLSRGQRRGSVEVVDGYGRPSCSKAARSGALEILTSPL